MRAHHLAERRVSHVFEEGIAHATERRQRVFGRRGILGKLLRFGENLGGERQILGLGAPDFVHERREARRDLGERGQRVGIVLSVGRRLQACEPLIAPGFDLRGVAVLHRRADRVDDLVVHRTVFRHGLVAGERAGGVDYLRRAYEITFPIVL